MTATRSRSATDHQCRAAPSALTEPEESGSSRSSLPSVVELFAGLGCVARGFERSGFFETILLTDLDADARDTYLANRPDGGRRYLRQDVQSLNTTVVLDAADGRPVAGLLGCPPCQGFSAAGLRDSNDPRNGLLRHFFRLLQALQPAFFLMENVPRVLDFDLLRKELQAADVQYRTWKGVLNAALFGLPQTRQRAVVLGYCRDLEVQPTPPRPTHGGSRLVFDYKQQRFRRPSRYSGPDLLGLYAGLGRPEDLTDEEAKLLFAPSKNLPDLVVVGESLGDLPPATDSDGPVAYTAPPSSYSAALRADSVHNQRRWRHNARLLERLRSVPEGGGPLDVDGRPARRYFSQAYTRLHRHGLARTVTTNFHNPGSGRFLHYAQLRTITIREAARLQGIEDGFVFVGNQYVQERLVGNAFPTLLAEALARHIARQLDGHLSAFTRR